MQLSPTWFLQTLSTQMWTFTIIAYFVAYFFFLSSLFVYRKTRKICETSDSSFGEVFIYMWNFIAGQGIQSRWSKYNFWKIQVLNISFLQIIATTAFSTFLVRLLSIKYYEVPFNEVEDFAKLRTHNICLDRRLYANIHFVDTKWKKIVNPPTCEAFLNKNYYRNLYEIICNSDEKIAYVVPSYFENNFKCSVVKLDYIIPKVYGDVMVHRGFRYKEQFNRMLIRMKAAGVLERITKSFDPKGKAARRLVDTSEEYKFEYNVETEGVMFLQIRYFVFFLFGSIACAFFILILEWIVYDVKSFLLK